MPVLSCRGVPRLSSLPPLLAVLAAILADAALAPAAHADRALARALTEEGQRLGAADQPQAALARYRQALAEDPDYLPASDRATALWLDAGEFGAVIRQLSSVTLRHPGHAPAWYALAYAYRKTGRFDLAVLCYETYLALQPDEPDPYYGLAMAELALGDGAAARVALERYVALEKRPGREPFVAHARAELVRLAPPPGPLRATLRAMARGVLEAVVGQRGWSM